MGGCMGKRDGGEEDINYGDIEPVPEPIKVEDIWNKFKKLNDLGIGTSSKVFHVEKIGTSAEYALKEIKPEYVDCFVSEFDVLKKVKCKNIVNVYEAYIDTVGNQYICMEYCSGGALMDRLTTQNSYTEGDAANYVKDILEALEHVHSMNIIHRDVKLQNLVFHSPPSKVGAGLMLLDFGLAEEVDPDNMYTPTGGTPLFWAPEVCPKGDEPGDDITGESFKLSDIWALGVCTYAILCGNLPFMTKDGISDLVNLINSPLEFQNEELSPAAKHFVSKLLERNVKNRLTAKEALQHSWILRAGKNQNEIVASTVEALRTFHGKYSFHRALQKLASELVTEYDRKYIRTIFDKFDRNDDNVITKDEFVETLDELMNTETYDYLSKCFNTGNQKNLTNMEKIVLLANEIIENADENEDHVISWEEFQHAIARCELSKDEHKMYAVFNVLDRNKDKLISREELFYCLHIEEEKEDLRDTQTRSIVKSFDRAANTRGDMNFDQFKSLLGNPKVWQSTLNSLRIHSTQQKELDGNVRKSCSNNILVA